MRFSVKKIEILSLLLFFIFVACTDEKISSMGSQLQPAEDAIVVKADTFHLNSSNYYPEYIYSSSDSFLLGNYYDTLLGTTCASVLAQLACPIVEKEVDSHDFYPENTVADSTVLYLYYRSYFGSGNAPVELSVYEMNQATFQYNEDYPSNLDVAEYCDKKNLLGQHILTPDDPKDSLSNGQSSVAYIRIKLDDDFTKRFFDIKSDTYHSLSKFTDFFKGLYINSDYGSDAMFHIIQMEMNLFYHFTYSLEGKDTTVNAIKSFPANSEVRQVNRFEHPDLATVKSKLNTIDTINYLSTPANVYTNITLPIDRMCDSLEAKLGNKALYVNDAELTINVNEVDFEKDALPVSNLMLIKKSALDRFFANKESLSDTCAITAAIASTQIDAVTYEYHYSFDISKIIQERINERKGNITTHQDLEMMLVPVKVLRESSNSGSLISGVEPEYLMTSTILKSAQHKSEPMKLNIIYSGF